MTDPRWTDAPTRPPASTHYWAEMPPPKPRHRRLSWWLGFGLVLFLGVSLVSAIASTAPEPGQAPGAAIAGVVDIAPPEVTMAEFNQLQEGMTHAQATAVIGSPGELVMESDMGPMGKATTYQYNGHGVSSATLTFTADRLTNRFQIGLG